MKNVIKNESVMVALGVLAILLVGVFVLPLLVALACKVLMIIFTKPVMALAVTGAFLIGMFVNEKLK